MTDMAACSALPILGSIIHSPKTKSLHTDASGMRFQFWQAGHRSLVTSSVVGRSSTGPCFKSHGSKRQGELEAMDAPSFIHQPERRETSVCIKHTRPELALESVEDRGVSTLVKATLPSRCQSQATRSAVKVLTFLAKLWWDLSTDFAKATHETSAAEMRTTVQQTKPFASPVGL